MMFTKVKDPTSQLVQSNLVSPMSKLPCEIVIYDKHHKHYKIKLQYMQVIKKNN